MTRALNYINFILVLFLSLTRQNCYGQDCLKKTKFLLLLLLFASNLIFAQPSRVEGSWQSGSYNNNIGTVSARTVINGAAVLTFRGQANGAGQRSLLFNNFVGNYNQKWVANNTNVNSKNIRLTNGAVYFTTGGSDINFITTLNNYYTFIVGNNSSSSNDLAILETSYNPTIISSASRNLTTVYGGQSPTITVTMSGALNTGENLYVYYSTDAFATSVNSTFVQITSLNGSFQGTASIPTFPGGTVVTYYVLTSNTTPTYADVQYQSLNIFNGTAQNTNAPNTTYTVQNLQFNGTTNALWSVGTNWNSGVAPSTSANLGPVTIAASCIQDQSATIGALTINDARTLTINASNTLQVGGAITRGAANTGVISVTGSLQFNTGASTTFAPTYNLGSTLVYNAPLTTSNEWNGGASISVAVGAGIPANVQVLSNTLTLAGGRGVPGNVTVAAAGGLTLNSTSGDLYIGGNLSNSGSWTNNSRAVVFIGTGTSTITASSGTQFFDYLLISKSAGSVQLTSTTNVTINSTTGNVLQFLNAGTLDLNGRTLTLHNLGGNILVDGTVGGTAKSIVSTSGPGIIAVTNSKTASANSSGTLASDANVTWLLTGGMNFGAVTTINGTLQINALGFITGNTPTYGTGSLLKYSSGGTYGRNFEWNGTTAPIGVPYNVQISNNTALNYVNASNLLPQFITNNLTIDSGSSLQMNYGFVSCNGTLSIGNNFASAGTMTLGHSSGDDLKIGGNFVNTGTFNCNNRLVLFNSTTTGKTISGIITGTSKMDYLTFNGVGGGWSIANDLEVSSAFAVANGSVNVNTSLTLTVGGAVTVTAPGTLTFQDKSSLYQTTFTGANSGAITYKRTTPPVINTDYTYWSSPVAGYTLGGVSPNTLPGMFYSFNSAGTPADWKQESSATTMVAGVGYIIRGPEYNETTATAYNASFVGVPNNGNITTPIISNGDAAGTSNLIGNPYPSSISADSFLSANSGVIGGTLYFWTHNTAIQLASNIVFPAVAGSGTYAYTSDDYASYNGVGGVAVSGGTTPTGKIAAGQGFFTTSLATTVAGSINATFTNTMRVAGNNSQFFKLSNTKGKTVSTIEKNRIWLNLTNSQGAFKQTLVGYITDATNGFDNRFDGESFNGNQFVDFYSTNLNKNLTIQGRALPFDENDIVHLGFRTSIDGTFAINIDQTDGLLANHAVYIEDKLTNTVFDLKSGSYSFTTTAGTFNDRFVLRYTNKTLGVNTNSQKSNDIIISTYENEIKIDSMTETISSITVYDINGKKLLSKSNINHKEITIDKFTKQNQVLLVKVKLSNDHESTQKMIF